jgi:methionyl-tRNA formyltransferase
MRIAFICNSEFALPTVEQLANTGLWAGLACSEGASPLIPALSARAREAGVPFAVLRKSHLAIDLEDFLIATRADAVLVQTFPFRIPAHVLTIPRLGFFNLHPGRLPAYRGADPIFWQIKHREPAGEIVLHRMTPAFDNGPILFRERMVLREEDTYGLHQSLLVDAALRVVERFVRALDADELPAGDPQDERDAGYQARPTAYDLLVDWESLDAEQVAALARAANPTYQGAIVLFRETMVRLLEARPVPFDARPRLRAGTVVSANTGRGLLVLCARATVARLEVLATEEGTFGGERFASAFGLRIGEAFSIPAFVS